MQIVDVDMHAWHQCVVGESDRSVLGIPWSRNMCKRILRVLVRLPPCKLGLYGSDTYLEKLGQ